MIPLSTPPGTEIVCTSATPHWFDSCARIKAGEIYTLVGWEEAMRVDGSRTIGVVISAYSFPLVWDPTRFRLLEIHPSLTALLTADPLEKLRLLERDDARV